MLGHFCVFLGLIDVHGLVKIKSQVMAIDGHGLVKIKSQVMAIDVHRLVKIKSQVMAIDVHGLVKIKCVAQTQHSNSGEPFEVQSKTRPLSHYTSHRPPDKSA